MPNKQEKNSNRSLQQSCELSEFSHIITRI